MTDDLEQLLRNLHRRRSPRSSTSRWRTPRTNSCPTATSSRGCSARSITTGRRVLTWRIKHAGLPEQWTLESFPFKRQPGVSAKQIRGFAELDFIAKAENIVFIGPTGVGKTGLASGLLLKAIQNGYRGRFIRAQDLFDEMYASLADRSTRKLLNTLIRIDLLVVDELGFVNLKPEQTNIFFKLMEERYRRRPTVITTNLDYPDWQSFLGNKVLVEALLSRLRHQCHTVRIDGPLTARAARLTPARRWTLTAPWTRRRVHRALQNRADAVSHSVPPPSQLALKTRPNGRTAATCSTPRSNAGLLTPTHTS